MILRFSDGIEIDAGGEHRVIKKKDGYYVVGRGMCTPVRDREEGAQLVEKLTNNTMCDGVHCKQPDGEVRLLPSGGNMILCIDCYNHEIEYRIESNKELSDHTQFSLPKWETLKVYEE